MKDITEQLHLAKVIIRNQLASHQSTAPMAAEYARRQTDTPHDLLPALEEYARKVEEAQHT